MAAGGYGCAPDLAESPAEADRSARRLARPQSELKALEPKGYPKLRKALEIRAENRESRISVGLATLQRADD
jgi:hypothetical protein